MEERDTLEQIILGASDRSFCVLTLLSIHLQYLLEFLNGENSDYLFCNSGKTPETVKALIGKAIRDHVTNNEGWRNLQEEGVDSGPVGSHLNRKLASRLACRQGCTQDDVDCRSRLTDICMSKPKGWTLQSSLLTLWMDENSNQQSNKNC